MARCGRSIPDEPRRIAEAVARLGLQHVVVTSVDRDDLPDGGAAHFAATAQRDQVRAAPQRESKCWCPISRARTKRRDGEFDSPVDIYNHNIETVPSLYRKCRPGGHYDLSLDVLAHAKAASRDARPQPPDQDRNHARASARSATS